MRCVGDGAGRWCVERAPWKRGLGNSETGTMCAGNHWLIHGQIDRQSRPFKTQTKQVLTLGTI